MNRSKDDLRYWQQKGLLKTKFKTADGTLKDASEWSARIMHEGKREIFPLKTPNRFQAATKARDIYRHILLKGWDLALREFKPEKANLSSTEDLSVQTVGDFLQVLQTQTDIPAKRLEGYSMAFRSIVASIEGIGKGDKAGSRQSSLEWRFRVHSVPLASITQPKVLQWKKSFMAKYGDDPLSQRKAKISVNSFLRRAKSLFASKYLQHLPETISNPFAGIKLEKRQNQRYRSTFNLIELLEAANEELRKDQPELYKILLLASLAGLRRQEIDTLLWEQVKFSDGVIRIEPTGYFHPKSEDSIGDVEVDNELLLVLADFKLTSPSPFVIQSPVQPNLDATYEHYRCESLFVKLVTWLREHGVQGEKPLHALRKEYGSILADKHGILVASQQLRHSDISVTSSHYIDRKSRKTVGLGAHL
jgi:integrase